MLRHQTRTPFSPLPMLAGLMVVAAVAGGMWLSGLGTDALGRLGTARGRLAEVLEPGTPAIEVLRVAGEPACREYHGDEAVWVYGRGDGGSPCGPTEGDTLVRIRGGLVVGFVAEWGAPSFGGTQVAQLSAFRE